MGDRATLERILAIMHRLLLVPMDGANPIPRKGTTRHECYRALYEIQELLETRGYSGKHFPQTNADRIRSMTDEELAEFFPTTASEFSCPPNSTNESCQNAGGWFNGCPKCWIDWLKEGVKDE